MSFARAGLSKPSTSIDNSSESATSSTKTFKPSDKLNPKTVDFFNTREIQKTAFGTIYSNGGIPCRLVHGSVKNKLMWNTPPEKVPFDPVLVILAEGLRETQHPFNFVAREGFKDLLLTHNASEKAIEILPKLVIPVKNAIVLDNDEIFEAGINALMQLSDAVGAYLNAHLKIYLSILCRRLTQKKYRDQVTDALNKFEQNGGKEVVPIIKTKIPTYNSVI
ncbi:hypothetical protein BpHYR1_032965 [Brachionus plicatilis]|uniref:PACRG n=1 Tax=Brachionus plicatilis TaxID=10195 RepID=A0A3M7REM6_BRAPC|nr:hypothetical protein BpHYR1_032965 [Brachionus plicatilis]